MGMGVKEDLLVPLATTNNIERMDSPSKPKRPLSSYNLFYRYKRSLLLEANKSNNGAGQSKEAINNLIMATPGLEGYYSVPTDHLMAPDEMQELRRAEIRSVLHENLTPSNTAKRSHNKSNNGCLSFLEMGKIMVASWKTIDDFGKSVFEELAAEGRRIYQERYATMGDVDEKAAESSGSSSGASYLQAADVRKKKGGLSRSSTWPPHETPAKPAAKRAKSSPKKSVSPKPQGTLPDEPKPKRPLSSYNLFYRYKRIKVLELSKVCKDNDGVLTKEGIGQLIATPPGLEEHPDIDAESISSPEVNEFRRAEIRYALLDNLSPNEAKGRSHRKSSLGVISFVDMSNMVVSSWRAVDDFAMSVFEELAEEGRRIYQMRIAEYDQKCQELELNEDVDFKSSPSKPQASKKSPSAKSNRVIVAKPSNIQVHKSASSDAVMQPSPAIDYKPQAETMKHSFSFPLVRTQDSVLQSSPASSDGAAIMQSRPVMDFASSNPTNGFAASTSTVGPPTSYNLFYRYKRMKILSAYNNAGGVTKEVVDRLIAAPPGLEEYPHIVGTMPHNHVNDLRRTEILSAMKQRLYPKDHASESIHGGGKTPQDSTLSEMNDKMRASWQTVDDLARTAFEELAAEGRRVHYKNLANVVHHSPAHRKPASGTLFGAMMPNAAQSCIMPQRRSSLDSQASDIDPDLETLPLFPDVFDFIDFNGDEHKETTTDFSKSATTMKRKTSSPTMGIMGEGLAPSPSPTTSSSMGERMRELEPLSLTRGSIDASYGVSDNAVAAATTHHTGEDDSLYDYSHLGLSNIQEKELIRRESMQTVDEEFMRIVSTLK